MSDIASKLVIVSGPSGAGKDTIVKELLKKDESLSLSVSATSREPRGNEQHGVEYYFISAKEFIEKSESGEFIEFAQYGSNYYGTLKEDVQKRIDDDKIVILVIEVKGAENVKKMYPDALSIFILPPSEEVLEKRLRARQTEGEADIAKRMNIAKTEIAKSVEYDYSVVNDDLQTAVDEVYGIICDNK